MLPDYPTTKSLLSKALMEQAKRRHAASLGIFATIRTHKHQEGDRNRMVYPDGDVRENEYFEASSTVLIKNEEYEALSQSEVTQKAEQLAADIGDQAARYAFGRLEEMLKQSGQMVDHGGRPISPETIFDALESIWIEFDSHGNTYKPTIVGPPQLEDSFRRAFEQIESDPELIQRHNDIMMQKWLEWRDREASRKLVG